MSKKTKQTPAEVASKIAQFLAKQEETLSRYPVGPMANSARANMKKGYAALEALKGQNEQMRVGQQPAPAPQQAMKFGGAPVPPAVSANISSETSLTAGQIDMMNYLKVEHNYSDAVALAAISPTSKESGGDSMAVENSYANTSAAKIRGINGRFKKALAGKTDAEIDVLKKDPEAFFNLVYKDATGNGADGDGYKYRGRGLVQLTGKANYAAASKELFGDDRLVKNPDKLLDPAIAGQVAGWFTATRGKGVEGYLDFDVSEENPSPEQLQQVMNGSYATIATGGTLSVANAQNAEYMSKNYGQYSNSMPKMQTFTADTLPKVQGSNAFQDTFNLPNPPEALAVEAANAVPQQPQANIPPELNDNILLEKALGDPKVQKFMERNNVSTSALQTAIGGDYVDIPNRAAFDANLRRVARDYTGAREEAISGPGPSKVKDQTGDSIGWSESTGISRERYKELRAEGEAKYPDAALAYIPGPNGTEGTFSSNAATPLGTASVEAEVPRDANGRPIFGGMQAKINYDNFNAGGQDFQRRGIDLSNAINESRNQFARNYLMPTAGVMLGGAALPYLASGAGMLSTLGAGEFGTALSTVGSQFMGGLGMSSGSTATLPGWIGGGMSALGTSSALSKATGDYGLEGGQANAFEVANDPNMSNVDKAAYFAEIGIGLSPAVFNSPTAIKNIFRGKPSDFPGSYGSYLNARRGLINTADDSKAAVSATEEAYQAARLPRVKSQGTSHKAGKADAKATKLEQKAATAQERAANAAPSKQAKANADAEKALQKASNARSKAAELRAADDAALKSQQAAGARRNNAVGRSQLADDELAAFNQQYNAARTPYGLTPAQRLPSQVAGALALGDMMPSYNKTQDVDPATVDPRSVQVQLADPQAPVQVSPEVNTGVAPGGGGSQGEKADPIGGNFEDGQGSETTPGTSTTADSDIPMTADSYNLNMGKGNLLMGIPAAAALGSAAIQRRALNKLEGPTAPMTTDIPAFNYESTIAQQMQDVRDNTRAMGQVDGLSAPQSAAMRQGLLGQRFKQEQRLRSADNQARQNAQRSYDMMATQVRQSNNALRNQYLNDARTFRNDMTQARADIQQAPLDVASNFAQDYLKNIYYPQQSLAIEQVGRLGQYGMPQSIEDEQ